MKSVSVTLKNGQEITLNIDGLHLDSRKIQQNFLFAALVGAKVDGRDFVDLAIQNGATYILSPTPLSVPDHVTVIISDTPRADFAHLVAAFYGKQPEHITAVTGTNGKSSTARFIEQLWRLHGLQAASLGTIGLSTPYREEYGSLTTPDPITLHEILTELVAHNVTHLALEASSHGLDQDRLEALNITVGGFTNLSRDHLDYHPTMDAYFQAKARLFKDILPDHSAAILNADCAEIEDLLEICRAKKHRITLYGKKAATYATEGDLCLIIKDLRPHPNGLHLDLDVGSKLYSLNLPLIGTFQAENVLCALGMCAASTDQPIDTFIPLLEKLTGVRGRMELAGTTEKNAAIYVDFAHTPDALETVLKAIRPHCTNKLHVIFGCGGDRDRGKRPEMGRVCTQLADQTILTDDNPRTEDPVQIRQDARVGCPDALEIFPREKAIAEAISFLETGDVLVIAGKGHEQGQIIGTTVVPFDDRDQVHKNLTQKQAS